MLPLIWRPKARQDLRDIIGYIAARRRPPPSASAMPSDTQPINCRPIPISTVPATPGTREAVIHPNYILIYRVTPDAIEVLSLIHARQQYP